LFEDQVNKTPNNIAIKFEDEILTYAEFEAKANKLAHRLIKEGVKAEVPVGIYMERSIEMMIALYGILKAGGAYLPLDPDYPDDRISFMTADAGLKIILTQDRFKNRFQNKSIKIFYLDSEWDIINAESPHRPEVQISEYDLAYIIYTSGSTGMPKGVMNAHKGVCNRLLWIGLDFEWTENDIVMQKTPFSFDVSVPEFFGPLIKGAALVLAKPGGHKDSSYLVDLIKRENITSVHFVPSMLHIFLNTHGIEECKSIRQVFCSGEALSYELRDTFFEKFNIKLHNLYGPTEAAVEVTYFECKKEHTSKSIPIGKPIVNTQIYILDKKLKPVPIGVPGEIHIGGTNLARGYLNRKELTEEKFIENPLEIKVSKKLYKTGDKGRYIADGNVEYLGRYDFQVKVRGYRIELGEIEAVLDQHHDITESVVITKNDYSGDTKIVAYLVTDAEKIDSNALKIFLSLKLPEYMIPNLFMKIESIPLTSSGKANRNALPEPDFSANVLESDFQAARDELELQLIKIWEKVLGIKSIGIRDNFFSLGGHSLLAAQLFNLIEKNMGKKIPIATLFQAPTVEKLAAIIHQEDWKPNWSSLIPIQPGGSKPPLFLVHGAEGYVLFYHKLAEYLGKDQPVYGLQAVGLYNKNNSHNSLEEMASHYIKEIKKLQPEGPYYLGGYCMGGTIAFEIAQQLKKQPEQIALLALLETYNIKSREKSPTLLEQLQYKFENVAFHLENLLMLNSEDKLKFFNQKFAVSKSRFQLKLKKLFKLNSSQYSKDETINSDLTLINEKAQACYCPNIYNGNVTLFRPKKGFSGYDFATFGWEEFAEQGVNIQSLNVNPRGMLVEPFVQELAEKLKDSIDKASLQSSMN
jgi:amino acid adenylation domain-containing protein